MSYRKGKMERMSTPKVSVVIPCYNVEKYLRQCLDSVINQTLKELEIICVNDGSKDSTLTLLRNMPPETPVSATSISLTLATVTA
jgi:cellulose synthase/poly-beta-1,6-N-acetylglucosamine synthase-like glycosyltransferase